MTAALLDAVRHLLSNDHGEWQVTCLLVTDGWTWIRLQVALWAPRVPFLL